MSEFNPEIRNAFVKWADYTGNKSALDQPGRYALLGTGVNDLHTSQVIKVSDSLDELLKLAKIYFSEHWRGIEPDAILDFQAESLETAMQEVSYRMETYLVEEKTSALNWMPALKKLSGGQEVLF